jgi:MarR family 2-MHQ and catechol resistance regulon transcriptional repressor
MAAAPRTAAAPARPPAAADVEDFFTALDSFARAVRRARGARVQAASRWLTLSQYGLIEPLADDGQRRVNELADAAGITGSTATRILDALERRGIVRRTRSADDRRAIAVTLTAEGRRLFEAQRSWVRERERALYDDLPPRQRRMATEVLGRFTELIDELAPGPPGDPA